MNRINIHTHQRGDGFCIVQQFPDEVIDTNDYISLGIHPWYANEKINWENFATNCKLKNVLFIGECGLDQLKGPTPSIQEEFFLKQINLSNQLNKPLIIHCVRAHERCLHLLKTNLKHQKVIFHGVRNKFESLRKIIEAGFYLSFGEALIHSAECQKTFLQTPSEQFFLETDDASIPISSLYQQAAKLKSIPEEKLQEQIISNFEKLLNTNYGYFLDE